MTRVERLNKAIEILFINKGMSAKQIQKYLDDRGHYLDLLTVVTVIQQLQYYELEPRKPQTRQGAYREELNKELRPIIDAVVEHKVPYSYVVRLLNEHELKVPGSGLAWTLHRLKKYMFRWKLYRRNGVLNQRFGLTYLEFCATLDHGLERLKEYQ